MEQLACPESAVCNTSLSSFLARAKTLAKWAKPWLKLLPTSSRTRPAFPRAWQGHMTQLNPHQCVALSPQILPTLQHAYLWLHHLDWGDKKLCTHQVGHALPNHQLKSTKMTLSPLSQNHMFLILAHLWGQWPPSRTSKLQPYQWEHDRSKYQLGWPSPHHFGGKPHVTTCC